MVQLRGQFFIITGVVVVSFMLFMYILMSHYAEPSSTYYAANDVFTMNNLLNEYSFLIKKQTTINYTNVDVVLVEDRSGSMDGQPMDDLKNASKAFVDLLHQDEDKIGVVSFSWTNYCSGTSCRGAINQSLTFNKTLIALTVDKLTPYGSTALYEGIHMGNVELNNHSRTGTAKILVLFTDGLPNAGRNCTTSSCRTTNAFLTESVVSGIKIYTVGLGEDSNSTLLSYIANRTGGKFYYAPNSSDLTDIYRRIAYEIHNFTADIPPFTEYVNENLKAQGMNVTMNSEIVNMISGTQTAKVYCVANCSNATTEKDNYAVNVSIHNYYGIPANVTGCWDLFSPTGVNITAGHKCDPPTVINPNITYFSNFTMNDSSLTKQHYMLTYTATEQQNRTEIMKICNYFNFISGESVGNVVNGLSVNVSVGSNESFLVGTAWSGISNCDEECKKSEPSCIWLK